MIEEQRADGTWVEAKPIEFEEGILWKIVDRIKTFFHRKAV